MNDSEFLGMLEKHAGLVKKIARDEGFDLGDDDLRQEAALALAEAARRHDPARGSLKTAWVEGCLRPALRRWRAGGRHGIELDVEDAPEIAAMDNLSDSHIELKLTDEEEAALEEAKDTRVIADRLGVTRRRAQQIAAAAIEKIAASVRARSGDCGGQLGLGF